MRHSQHYCAAAPGLAAPPGLSPPRNDEPRELVGSGAGLRGLGQANIPDCASTSAKCKRFNTLRARVAMAGWTLAADETGALTASRWGMARDLGSLAAAEAFAAQVGALS